MLVFLNFCFLALNSVRFFHAFFFFFETETIWKTKNSKLYAKRWNGLLKNYHYFLWVFVWTEDDSDQVGVIISIAVV